MLKIIPNNTYMNILKVHMKEKLNIKNNQKLKKYLKIIKNNRHFKCQKV